MWPVFDPPWPPGVDNPGLRRLEEDTAGLVNLDEGWEEAWAMPEGVLLWLWCPLVNLCAIALAIAMFGWTGGTTADGSFVEVWTGVAVPEDGIKSSRHFFTKLLAREANCLSLALRRSSFMCLPSRVAWKKDMVLKILFLCKGVGTRGAKGQLPYQ